MLTKYKGYDLSRFQIESIEGIKKRENIIVSTHTGNGKTLIADYAVNKCFDEGRRVVYTAPIKALSNQKYNDFIKEYGRESVGLLTGDRTINSDALILVATTEVLRNIIHEDSDRAKDIEYVILDEIHYISDEERGTVWEEIIIFKHENTKIIGLSATVPNIKEFCDWVASTQKQKTLKVHYPKRIVPQRHYYFDKTLKETSLRDVLKNYTKLRNVQGKRPYRNTHVDFIKHALHKNRLPILCFVFSRNQCEEKAFRLSQEYDLLDDEEKNLITKLINDYERKYKALKESDSWGRLKDTLFLGIGFHHAGLLPIIKQFMEELFEMKVCKVLYATETFAVGVNYPVKTVYFDSLRKYDGKIFRNLNGSEYLQMAGRAGRRGIDDCGLVYVSADYRSIEMGDFPDIKNVKADPITSQFKLSYNVALNLTKKYSEEEIKMFFKKSFANYQYKEKLKRGKGKQKKGLGEKPDKLFEKDYNKRIKFLEHLGYISNDKKLLPRGEICSQIHMKELLITELFFNDFFQDNKEAIIAGVCAGIVCDNQDLMDAENNFLFGFNCEQIYSTIHHITKKETTYGLLPSLEYTESVCGVMKAWYEGVPFFEIVKASNFTEGDLVSLCRRTADILKQVRNVSEDNILLKAKIGRCISNIDRGVVSLGL